MSKSSVLYANALRKAKPKWLTKDDRDIMKIIREEAKLRRLIVDHIVPIRGNENVCGLHVYWNTQLLTPSINVRKASKYPFESPRVFTFL